MSNPTDPVTACLLGLHRVNTDLLWALEWLNSLTDDLNAERYQRNGDEQHPRTSEFLADLAQRRIESDPLDVLSKEVFYER